jgi:predicted  nucleic acid-binding Zn-ribbon protein
LCCLWILNGLFDYGLCRDMPIELEVLKNERDKLREKLREVEADVRKAEADLKVLRQREIQTKREIEALSILVDIKETRDKPAEGS